MILSEATGLVWVGLIGLKILGKSDQKSLRTIFGGLLNKLPFIHLRRENAVHNYKILFNMVDIYPTSIVRHHRAA